MVPAAVEAELGRLKERVRSLDPEGPPAAVVMNAHVTALAVARSLARRGVPVVALDRDPGGVALYSRHVVAAGLCPNPLEDEAGLVEFLLGLAEAFPRPPVLMGCMDEWVLAVARHHARLAGGYRIPFPDASVVEAVLDKGRLYARARALGVPLPRTVEVGTDPDAALEAAGWPVLLKPRDKRGFYDHFGVALFAPETPEEFRRQARAGVRFGLLAQEKVPVEAGGHVTLVGYVDRSGRVAADFVGRRLAIYPPGSTCPGWRTPRRRAGRPGPRRRVRHRAGARLPAAGRAGPARPGGIRSAGFTSATTWRCSGRAAAAISSRGRPGRPCSAGIGTAGWWRRCGTPTTPAPRGGSSRTRSVRGSITARAERAAKSSE